MLSLYNEVKQKMYINPLSDIVFKYLLGREETKDLLLSFINSVLEDSDLETMHSIEKPDLLHTCFMAFDKRDKDLLLSENFQIHFIELKKYQNNLNKLKKTLNDWVCYFLNEDREEETVKTVLEENPLLNKVHREYKKFTMDDQMREIYEYQEKKRKDEKTLINSFYKKGVKEGINQGIKEGEIKGEKRGKIETAKNMLKDGFSTIQIQKYTGLSVEEIQKIVSQDE
ncbi:MAG TPA: hypothetical protein DHW82_06615 [Spirochaetia bacterium]|nr:hypothetical protein [Spirochaetia bacterium]